MRYSSDCSKARLTAVGADTKPESRSIRLSLYNVSGQRIRTLVDGERPAGSYSVTWDGRDDAGRDAGSGVYLCRMEVGDYCAVRKLALVR